MKGNIVKDTGFYKVLKDITVYLGHKRNKSYIVHAGSIIQIGDINTDIHGNVTSIEGRADNGKHFYKSVEYGDSLSLTLYYLEEYGNRSANDEFFTEMKYGIIVPIIALGLLCIISSVEYLLGNNFAHVWMNILGAITIYAMFTNTLANPIASIPVKVLNKHSDKK